MDISKSQQYNFAYEALPTLFHSQTNDFFKYIERDGLKFLRFWWDHVGEKYDGPGRLEAKGLGFKIHQLYHKTRMVMVSLPAPKAQGDPILVCLVGAPERRFFWVRLPTTRVFSLELGASGSHEQTIVYEVTPRLRRLPRGGGCQPTTEDFGGFIRKLIKKQRRSA